MDGRPDADEECAEASGQNVECAAVVGIRFPGYSRVTHGDLSEGQSEGRGEVVGGTLA